MRAFTMICGIADQEYMNQISRLVHDMTFLPAERNGRAIVGTINFTVEPPLKPGL